MTQKAGRSEVRDSRQDEDGFALFVLAREERGSSDLRFMGALSGRSAARLADVLRQLMRRGPTLLHFDLREVTTIDAEGVKHLAHAFRIGRRHGAMVKISTSRPVVEAVEAAGASAALGILPWSANGDGASSDGDRPRSRGPSPRF